jgi:hypothetical protein
MSGYRIGFFNELTNDSGHVFHCCQRVVEIRSARSKDRAIEAAKRHFARREKIANWNLRAHFIEVAEINP